MSYRKDGKFRFVPKTKEEMMQNLKALYSFKFHWDGESGQYSFVPPFPCIISVHQDKSLTYSGHIESTHYEPEYKRINFALFIGSEAEEIE